jgi:hypothetical protein
MVILGLVVEANHIPPLTRDFLGLKRRFFPGRYVAGPALDHILLEVKGSEILQWTRSDSRNKRRLAARLRTELLDLVEQYGCRLIGRIWIKEPGLSLKPSATYCYAVQDIASHFSQYLLVEGSEGLLIADSRNPGPNIEVAHSIFTQKWRAGGDPFPPLRDVPLFAHSDNHVGLQIADLIASSMLFPMAAFAYGAPAGSVHSSGRYRVVREDHGKTLQKLQYRYRDETGRWRGGIVVSDNGGKRSGSLLFGPSAGS